MDNLWLNPWTAEFVLAGAKLFKRHVLIAVNHFQCAPHKTLGKAHLNQLLHLDGHRNLT